MRLDKFLFFTRLTKTRSLAQHIIAEGHIRIDGIKTASAHASISAEQVLTLPLRDTVRVIRVDALPLRRGPAAEARTCYTDISPKLTIDAGRS
jgi:ribosome-associated heat shock protein Hsp15